MCHNNKANIPNSDVEIVMQIFSNSCKQLGLAATVSVLAISGAVQAQSSGDAFIEEIMVTATKRTGGISVQDAAVAITAFGEDQIDAMYLRDLKAIGFTAPNVQLEDIGTTRGTANFSIRGLGINSSIPSIDPTVGVFIDGMYLGLNAGVVMDTFDLEGIEVLRGPQGLLFGRNVTGGAVLMRTTRPTEELMINARVAYESGDNKYISAVIAGPLSDAFRGKFAAYYNDDGGWHENQANGNDSFGKAETKVFRGALEWDITDDFALLLRVEDGASEGDGPASQNGGLYSTSSFDFAIDNEGFYDNEWSHAILEATWDVSFGDGQFVNILAWREYDASTMGDIDAQALSFFDAPARLDHSQISNELRYNGTFGNIYLTTGLYYFSQEVEYIEQRELFQVLGPGAPPPFVGGGIQNQDTVAIFASVDWSLSDQFILNLGGRFTEEKKDAKIATIFIPAVTGSGCDLATGCENYDFIDDNSWTSFTPKIGFQYFRNDESQLYGFWTKGYRSGGYNLRHTSLTDPNERFDQEEQNSFELGLKKDFSDGKIRLNIAGFYNTVDNMQREVNLPSAVAGVVQLTKNTADSIISGAEAEFHWLMADNLFLQLSAGYVDGRYTEVRFDLNGDGVIDQEDENLDLPRLSPWTYGATFIFDHEFSFGSFTAQISGYHRDAAAYTDSNVGQLRPSDMVDASLRLGMMENKLLLSVFGRNLKNESTIGGDTQLPASFGVVPGTFSPLNKGRVYGVELQYRY
jgi:iron complex outermembrane receptor protein